jgi:mannose-6-phosphate isomerase-like protein (cupin superfamily)
LYSRRNLFSCFSIAHLEDLQNQSIIFDNHSTILCEGVSIMTTRQRTRFSAFASIVEELRTWTSKEVAHNRPAKDQPSILPAQYALTLSLRHLIQLARLVPVSRSSPALGPHGTAIRLRQTLIVTAGSGRVQRWGGPIKDIRPGDVVWFPPGEKHWHGATPTTAMTHIAIQERLDGKTVDWMEKVSDEQYQA